jgi:FkbM family methyltransferase
MNKFINSLRTMRNILRKSNAGVSVVDKWKCLVVCLRFEAGFLQSFFQNSLKLHCSHGYLFLNVVHRYSGKPFKISLRSGNDADLFIFWEFLGGFYKPPKSASAIMDCGANIGLFSIHAGLIFPEAQITCYEPDKENFELLQKNLRQNGILAECRNQGVWSSKISGYFHSRQAFDGFISLDPSDFPVECELPEIVPGTWLKMDVEGAEYEVLPALMQKEVLPIQVSMEIHDFHARGGKLIELLQCCRYENEIVTDGSTKAMFAEVTAVLRKS